MLGKIFMNEREKIELKETLKIIYKLYKAGKSSLNTVLNFFKIPVDENRLNNYQINKIDVNDLFIEVFDNKTNNTYMSYYKSNSETLSIQPTESATNPADNTINFIEVFCKNQSFERETVYCIDKEIPILDELRLLYNGYVLYLTKTMSILDYPRLHNLKKRRRINVHDGNRFKIEYYKGYNCEFCLFLSIYKANYKSSDISSFEHFFIDGHNRLTFKKNIPNQFYFDFDGNICKGSKFSNNEVIIEGACLEKINEDSLKSTLTYDRGNHIKDYSDLDYSNMNSAILYAGYCNYDDTSYYHDLMIIKYPNKISIDYKINDRDSRNPNPFKLDESFSIPNLSLENINIPEIDLIIQNLKEKFKDDKFIQFVIRELLDFKEKLKIRNGESNEVYDKLTPKLLIDTPFDEICNMVTSDLDDYFALAQQKFELATETNLYDYQGQEKALKLKL